MTFVYARQLKSSHRQLIGQFKKGRADIAVVVLKTARYQYPQLVVQHTAAKRQTEYFVNRIVTKTMTERTVGKIPRSSQILGIEYPRTAAETWTIVKPGKILMRELAAVTGRRIGIDTKF